MTENENRFVQQDLALGGVIGGIFTVLVGIVYILGTSITLFEDQNYDRNARFLAQLGAYSIFFLGIAAMLTGLCSKYNTKVCRLIIIAIAIIGFIISILLASLIGIFLWIVPFLTFTLTARR